MSSEFWKERRRLWLKRNHDENSLNLTRDINLEIQRLWDMGVGVGGVNLNTSLAQP